MRSAILFLMLTLSFNGFAASAKMLKEREIPDLIVRAKLDHGNSQSLLRQIRTFMVNNDLGDFEKNKLEDRFTVMQEILSGVYSQREKEFFEQLALFTGINVNELSAGVALDGVYYRMKNLSMDLVSKGDHFEAEFKASGLCISVDKVEVNLSEPYGQYYSPILMTALKKPTVLIGNMSQAECFSKGNIDNNDSRKEISFKAQIKQIVNENNYKLKILGTDFNNFHNLVMNKRDLIKVHGIEKKNMVVDDVGIEIAGSSSIVVKGEKIKEYLVREKEMYIKILLDEFGRMIEREEFAQVVNSINEVVIDREYWIPSGDFNSVLKINKLIHSPQDKGYVNAIISGGFCSNKSLKKKGRDCLNELALYYQDVGNEDLRVAFDNIQEVMLRNDARIVVSASEAYINKVIDLAFKLGYMDEAMTEPGIYIGPEGGFVKLNQRGKYAKFYFQVGYKPNKFQSILIGAKKNQLLIPAICDVSMRIEIKNKIPRLIFRVEDIDIRKETVMHGDQYMKSTLHKMKRFKGKVWKIARDQMKKLIGEDMFYIDLPEIKNLGLEDADLEVDGNGRVNIHITK